MRLGLAQINPTVGDLDGNRRLILEAYAALVAQGAELVVFPELAVCGYPPRDLLFKQQFVPDVESTLREIAAHLGAVPALIGTVAANPAPEGRRFFNAAALCRAGRIESLARKCLLPTYDVFDEDRYFEPAKEPSIVEIGGCKVGVTICEDIWTDPALTPHRLYHFDPVKWLAARSVDLMVNLSASPWHHGKGHLRQQLVTDAARALGCPVVYVNAIGGNDELIFDGRSLVADAQGRLTTALAAFAVELRVVEIPIGRNDQGPATSVRAMGQSDATVTGVADPGPASPRPATSPSKPSDLAPDPGADIFAALVLGLRDYAHKSGFKQALVALSGGIDSAVVAVLAAAALGAENVTGVSLPSAISSQHSRDDARALAQRLGLRFETLRIADVVMECEKALWPLFTNRPRDVTEENLQARVRGVLMMALSNKFGALLLTTGNKSEVAVGYCTLYGDMCGGLAVISDVFKTQVYALARWINRERELIPANTIAKPPSAELRPGQLDQDSLPPYDMLDAILKGYVEDGLSRRDLVTQGFAEAVVHDVVRKVDLSEYKRKQAAPGLKITPLAFGVGRRIPLVQKYRG
jgi:NAD+ synthase (glutamine-hydrolysing)